MNKLKRMYLKGLVAYKNKRTPKLDEEQQLVYDIVHKMCLNNETKLIMMPSNSEGMYYLEDKQREYFAVLTDNAIKITNHNFYIVRHYSDKTMLPLIRRVRHRIDRDRISMEKEIFKNELNLLKKISNSLEK